MQGSRAAIEIQQMRRDLTLGWGAYIRSLIKLGNAHLITPELRVAWTEALMTQSRTWIARVQKLKNEEADDRDTI